ncbi:hypothetical protein SeLEV6574_g02931 [Synchytrium endobioticum]|uniref:F-box domain-containing protein n=1 Tax=Synchytrium endobioticum TaxID=286115 RepID=A0A507D670_9FUNG|nr:hypothetical protein SeLEV6574_g02931 [Synchytrium endobioticum]
MESIETPASEITESNHRHQLSLPTELLLAVFEHVRELRTLSSLCRASKSFNQLAIPILYNTIDNVAHHQKSKLRTSIVCMKSRPPHLYHQDALPYTKNLGLVASDLAWTSPLDESFMNVATLYLYLNSPLWNQNAWSSLPHSLRTLKLRFGALAAQAGTDQTWEDQNWQAVGVSCPIISTLHVEGAWGALAKNLAPFISTLKLKSFSLSMAYARHLPQVGQVALNALAARSGWTLNTLSLRKMDITLIASLDKLFPALKDILLNEVTVSGDSQFAFTHPVNSLVFMACEAQKFVDVGNIIKHSHYSLETLRIIDSGSFVFNDSVLPDLKSLKTLSLIGEVAQRAGLVLLLHTRFDHLTYLALSLSSNLPSSNDMLDLILQCRNLSWLDLNGFDVTDRFVYDAITRLDKLEHMDVNITQPMDGDNFLQAVAARRQNGGKVVLHYGAPLKFVSGGALEGIRVQEFQSGAGESSTLRQRVDDAINGVAVATGRLMGSPTWQGQNF